MLGPFLPSTAPIQLVIYGEQVIRELTFKGNTMPLRNSLPSIQGLNIIQTIHFNLRRAFLLLTVRHFENFYPHKIISI